MKVAAIGRTEMLYDSILEVKRHGHEIVLIITCQESPEYKRQANDFKLLAESFGVDFIQTENINSPEVISVIKRNAPDIAISVNWRTIIGQEVLDCFQYGIINAHAGDLPRYRGNAVPNWAIISGEKEIVLTLHLMVLDLDAGPILLQRKIFISNNTHIGDVYEFIRENFPVMFAEAVDGLEKETITPQQQPTDPSCVLRCYIRTPKDSEIDWKQLGIQLDRLVRAVSEPFAGAYTHIGTEKLIIWRAHYEPSPSPFLGVPGQVAEKRPATGEVLVVTGEGFLVLEEIETQDEGRKKATEVIKTTRTRLGMDIIGEIVKLTEKVRKLEGALPELRYNKSKEAENGKN